MDDALDLFDALMATRLIRATERTSREQKLAAFGEIRRASTTLATAMRAPLATGEDVTGDVS